MQRLHNKLCVVTGAARGIGRAIAARFHTEGATVIATDLDEPAGTSAARRSAAAFPRSTSDSK